MPTIPQSELPRPKSWDEFEDIVWDLYARAWDDPNAQRYGRSGQAQQGVDIYGQPPHLQGGYAGVQCKRYEPGKLTQSVIEAEIAKAEAFEPPLAEYTIATTHPRDAVVQHIVREINEERTRRNQFPIHVVFWQDICNLLSHPDNIDLLQKHYRDWMIRDSMYGPVFSESPLRHIALTPDDRQKLERHYLTRVEAECRSLQTEGVDEVGVELTSVFVMLEALESPRPLPRSDILPQTQRLQEMGVTEQPDVAPKPKEAKPGQQVAPKPPPAPVPLSQALRQHLHLVILGEPGTGKTTALQFLALCFASEGLAKERPRLEEPWIPIWLDLRKDAGRSALGEMLVSEVANVGGFDPLRKEDTLAKADLLVRAWWEDGKLAILLDGLDEIPEARRSSIVASLQHFANPLGGQRCRTVVTSRIAGYRQSQQLAEFAHYTLCPLSRPEDTLSYVTGWLQATRSTEARTAGIDSKESAKSEAERLLQQMTQRPGLQRVMSNPLLLRLAIDVYRDTGEVVNNRAELYWRYVKDVRYERAKVRRKSRWSFSQVDEALQAVAWALQTQGEHTADKLEAALDANNADELLTYLRTRLGLLAVYRCEKGERVAFSHSTFREYFVARRLAKSWREDRGHVWRFLRPRLHLPTWREPILLLMGMLEPDSATELVKDILRARSAYERELRRDLLLAGEGLVAGVGVASTLRQEVLDRLLALYVEQVVSGSTDTYRRLVTRPIEEIVASLYSEDHDYIRDSLLTVAKGKARSGFTAPKEIAADPELGRYAAIKALGDLNMKAPELMSTLLVELDDVSTRYAAAASLGVLDLGTREVGTALVVAMQEEVDANGWNWTVAKIAEVLGVLGQKHLDVVELLLGIAESPALDSDNFRDAVTRALFKAAGTNRRAMAYILRRWQRYDTCRSEYDRMREVWELREGDKLIDSASLGVIQYLFDVIRDCSDRHTREKAAQFLDQVAGDSPLVSCLVVERDGTLRHQTVDLTDELFGIFLWRPNLQPFGGGGAALPILVRWGQSRPELIARLINVVQGADPWILAHMLEWENMEQIGAQRASIPEETITALRQSVASLRSPDEAEREAELMRWVDAAESAPAEHWHLRCLLPGIQAWKCQILCNAYNMLWSNLWPRLESRLRQLPVGMTPYVIAALACFRGWAWHSGFPLPPAMTADDLRDGFQVQADRAFSILQSRDRQTIEVLSAIVAGESSGSLSANLVKRLGDELGEWEVQRWHQEGGPGPRERGVAAHALAELVRDHPEVQEILRANLDPQFWYQDANDPEVEFQEYLIRALGYMKRANRDVVKALLKIAREHDRDVRAAGSKALQQLRDPDPGAVSVLIEGYEGLTEWGRAHLVEALGWVRPGMAKESKELVSFLLGALAAEQRVIRSAAARALGNLRETDTRVVDALLISARDNVAAAEAIGKLADCFTPGDEASIEVRLRKAARVLRKTMLTDPPLSDVKADFNVSRSSKDVGYESLDRVVTKLTELEVAKLPVDLPLSAVNRVKRVVDIGRRKLMMS